MAIAVVVAVAIASPSRPEGVIRPQDLVDADSRGALVEPGPPAEVGRPAPSATFDDLATGERRSLADFRGSPVIMNFWGSTCAPCVAEMPIFEALHQRIGDKVKFLGIDVSDSVEAGRKMVERTGVTYPSGRDPGAQMFVAFGGTVQPYTVFIRPDGTVAGTHNGAVADVGELTDLLTDYLP